jgi:hypothetical protein
MPTTYSPDYIYSFQNKVTDKFDDLAEFVSLYDNLVKQDSIKPLFSQTCKYELFPKKKIFKRIRIKDRSVWRPTLPRTDNEKMRKTIKTILNKITEKNYGVLIETLMCEIGKFTTYDILDILADEIVNKIVYDSTFHNIYIKLCSRIWSMAVWHQYLITIVVDDNEEFFWYKNTSLEEHKLHGPYESEEDIRKETNNQINFRNVLLDKLNRKFLKIDKYIEKSNTEDESRYIYRRHIFGIMEFIGKLYKKNFINEKIIHNISLYLLDYTDKLEHIPEEYIETFCILWKIVLEKITSPIRDNIVHQYYEYLNENILTRDISLRIKFMIEDSIKSYEKKYKRKLRKVDKDDSKTSSEDDEKQDKFDEIEDILSEFKYKHNVETTSHKLISYKKYINDVLDLLVYTILDDIKNEKYYLDLLKKCSFYKRNHIEQAIQRTYDNLDDITLDIPNAKSNLLHFIKSYSNFFKVKLDQSMITNIVFSLDQE